MIGQLQPGHGDGGSTCTESNYLPLSSRVNRNINKTSIAVAWRDNGIPFTSQSYINPPDPVHCWGAGSDGSCGRMDNPPPAKQAYDFSTPHRIFTYLLPHTFIERGIIYSTRYNTKFFHSLPQQNKYHCYLFCVRARWQLSL